MLDVLFNDSVTVRRLSGQRDGHGKATLVVITEQVLDPANESATDAPLFVECYIDRRRRMTRTTRESQKSVDATLYYNKGEAPVTLLDEDIIVVESTGETYKVDTIHDQGSSVEGSEYGLVGLTRTKAPVTPNAASSEEV